MALLWHWSDKMGSMIIHQGEKKFKINIYAGNCLAIFIYEYKNDKKEQMYNLYSFLADVAHAKNIIRRTEHLFEDGVTNVELNLYYKSAHTLLDLFMKTGYKVKCFYKEPKVKSK